MGDPVRRLIAAFAILSVLPASSAWPDPGGPERPVMRALKADEKVTAEALWRWRQEGRELLLLDARDDRVYRESRIPGAVLPLPAQYYEDVRLAKHGFETAQPDLTQAVDEAMRGRSKDTPIVVYCARRCQASTVMVVVLKHLGFNRVWALEDGVDAWQERGYAMQLGVPKLSDDTEEYLGL